VCKNLTSYIFSLYLKAPQTWYNLFPRSSSILLVLFISSLLTFIPVVFFSYFYFLFYSFVLWKVLLFLENISHFFLDCFTFKKREIPKFSNFCCRQATKIPLEKRLVTFYMITNTFKISYLLRWSLKKGEAPSNWPNGLFQGHPPCALFTRYLIQWPLISTLHYKWRRRGNTTMKPIVIADRVELGSRSSSWIRTLFH